MASLVKGEKNTQHISLKTSISLFVLGLILSCSSAYPQKKNIYITDTGKKYHLESCRYLRFSKKIIELDSAVSLGYEACKVCKPGKSKVSLESSQKNENQSEPETEPELRSATSVRCSATTQRGTRCKRMTKNSSGKCWQHE